MNLRPVKFAVVGASGVLVNTVVLWFLTSHGLWVMAASAVAIEVSVLNNFIWNDLWTFRAPPYKLNDAIQTHGFGDRILLFHLVSAGGGLINWGVLYVLFQVLGIWYLLANLGGILIAFVWNYKMNLSFTWKHDRQPHFHYKDP